MEDLDKRILTDRMNTYGVLSSYSGVYDESYDNYKKYDYQNRVTFQKSHLPSDLIKTVKFGTSGIQTDCYLYSVTEINEEFYEVAFKIEDAENFDAWERGKDKTASLEKSLREMGFLIPDGVGIKYVRFMRGSLIVIVGLILVAAASPLFITGATFFAALSALFSVYKAIAGTEAGKKFLAEFDRKALGWLKGVLVKIEDWLLASSVNLKTALKLAVMVAGSVGSVLFPIPTLIAAGLIGWGRKR